MRSNMDSMSKEPDSKTVSCFPAHMAPLSVASVTSRNSLPEVTCQSLYSTLGRSVWGSPSRVSSTVVGSSSKTRVALIKQTNSTTVPAGQHFTLGQPFTHNLIYGYSLNLISTNHVRNSRTQCTLEIAIIFRTELFVTEKETKA